MNMFRHVVLGFALAATAFGCGGQDGILEPAPSDFTKVDGKDDSSVEALFVDFEFDGELIASSSFNPRGKIQDQLLYTIGHLNGERSVSRLDQLELTNIDTEQVDGGVRIAYHARVPVAWGKRDNVPASYTFRLPRMMTYDGLEAFADKYKDHCVDFSAHDVTSGNMWYYYRTKAYGCDLADEDIVTIDATVSLSSINTTGKYPEYDKVWEDGVLRVVAVFGKYEASATESSDAGISAYNRFTRSMKDLLGPHGAITTPAEVPYSPGVDTPDIVFEAELAAGRRVVVNTLLVDNVRTAGPSFDARYGELSSNADLIVYSGHAGLGANIRALARKGEWVPNQYVIVFMNGCDTYAYVDDAIFEAHAEINPGDPQGTRHVDMVTNAMPAFFHSMPAATTAFIDGLMRYDEPQTFEKMFTSVASNQVVLVSGEQDNTFVPGGGGGGGDHSWDGITASGSVAAQEEHRFHTPALPAGRYLFEIDGTNDADLYVRIGEEPTVSSFDCRPFRAASQESCSVELAAPAPVHIMVRGWADSSTYTLTGRPN